MQQAIYNASDQQFYNESLSTLYKEKKRLEVRLQMLQETKANKEKLTYIFTIIFIFWTIFGVARMIYQPINNMEGESFGIYYFVIFGLLLLITFYRIIRMDRTGANVIATDIIEIERKIYEMERKASHEQSAANSNDLKPKSEPAAIQSIPKSTPLADEKHCPICAETVKAAAIVCHFCGYSF